MPQQPPRRDNSGLAELRADIGVDLRPATGRLLDSSGVKDAAARGRAIRNHSIAFLLCVALGFIFTLPGSLSLGSGLLGYPGDNFQHAWFLWHFARAVLHGHDPFYTRLIYYPSRVNLAWSTTDPLAGFFALPLSAFAGPVVAYNFSVILQLALAAFCARLLCLRISRNESAAFIGGVVFGFSPYLMAHALAHLSLITAFPIPLFVLALDRIFRSGRPSWKMGIPLGVALLLASFAHYNYVVLCLVFAALFLALETGRHFRRGTLKAFAQIWKPVSAGAATFIAGFSPFLWMMLGTHSEAPASRGLNHIDVFSADALGFLIPSWNHLFLGRFARRMNPDLFAAGIEGTVYIGIVVLALAAVGFWKGRDSNRRWATSALILGIAFYLLSLGPRIHLLGRALPIAGPAALFYHLPFAKFLSAPARFDAMLALCVGILCSLGAKYLLELPANKTHRYWIAPLIVLLVMADYLTIPFPRSSTIDPGKPFAAATANPSHGCVLPSDTKAGTILTFPLVKAPYCLKSMWMQVASGGKYAMVDGYLSYTPPDIWKPFWNIRILRSLMSLEGIYNAPIDGAADHESAAATIGDLNLSAVVVYDSPERAAGVEYIEKVFGAKPERSGTCTVFPLQPPENTRADNTARPTR
ncbi:MAG: hypothetical protein ACRD4R_16070 [Candidatus Acidiferrales bacterium]